MTPEPTSQDPNGIWQFPSPPIITQPATRGIDGLGLEQTITTNIGNTYRLQFWVSGEDALSAVTADGIFSLGITGYDDLYIAAPVGPARTYTFEFTATSATTTMHFHSWGHFDSTSWPSNPNPFGTSELILDDVIVNKLNNPATLDLTPTPQTYCSLTGSVVVTSNGIDSDGDVLTYTLKTSNPEYFVIDSSTGLVTLAQANVPAGTYALEVDVTDGVSTVPQTIDVTITDGAPCVITVNDPAPASKELAKTGRPIASMLAIAVSVISLGFVVLKSKPLGNRS